ncbi:hypothetical protein T4B_4871 [Trichinella pseudospiralis]|uniref:Uncharacterized protein n=1 Tax=Trichinella pseudospiralis TaxID=6337 RepID=A0A0V1J1V0_TRIPS|nr:hypothetical protein T4B_4871 [Trichinella pseudospiralis]
MVLRIEESYKLVVGVWDARKCQQKINKKNENASVTSRCYEQARPFLPPDCWHVPRYLSMVRYWPHLVPSFLPHALTMALRQQNNNNGFILY